MVIFLPILAGIASAVMSVVRFLAMLRPFLPMLWTAVIGIGKFLLSWKGALITLFGGYLVSSLFGWGEGYMSFLMDVSKFIVEQMYKFLLNEESGLAWDICSGIFWLGGEICDGLSSLNLFDQTFGAYAGQMNLARYLIGIMDIFVPVVECGILLGLFLGFLFVFLMIKLILKLIPGIG